MVISHLEFVHCGGNEMIELPTEKFKRNVVLALVLIAPIGGIVIGMLLSLLCAQIFGFFEVAGRSAELWMEVLFPVIGGAVTATMIQNRLNDEKIYSFFDGWYVSTAYVGGLFLFTLAAAKLLGFWH
jgi:hypothetical protein